MIQYNTLNMGKFCLQTLGWLSVCLPVCLYVKKRPKSSGTISIRAYHIGNSARAAQPSEYDDED